MGNREKIRVGRKRPRNQSHHWLRGECTERDYDQRGMLATLFKCTEITWKGRLKSGGHLKGGEWNYSWPAQEARSETRFKRIITTKKRVFNFLFELLMLSF